MDLGYSLACSLKKQPKMQWYKMTFILYICFVTLADLVSQEFGQGIVRMSALSSVARVSFGRIVVAGAHSDFWGWNHLESSSHTC